MKNLIIFFLFLISLPLISQHKIGVRAGTNYSKFTGPLEEGEDYGISSGFHFGINYTYLLNDIVSFRGELLYIQRGTKQTYQDSTNSSYYIINSFERSENTVIFGSVNYQLDVSNAYFSIPLTANFRLNKKFEAFAGVSADFLIGPSARGLIDFDNEELFFRQSLDYQYGSDVAGGFNIRNSSTVVIEVNEETLTVPRFIGAYYNLTEEQVTGQRFKRIDANLVFGLNYFINSGFYIGARGEYGLSDKTNTNMDFSLRELDADRNFIFRDDSDHSISLSVSFGFRF